MDSINFKEIGNNIKTILNKTNYSVSELSDKLNISERSVKQIISGRKALNTNEIDKIAVALDTSFDELIKTHIYEEQTIKYDVENLIKNNKTKEKVKKLQLVIEEILMLEELTK